MTNRGERIAQKERNRERWRRIFRQFSRRSTGDQGWVERSAVRAAQHGKLCSCWMCGNRRESEGESMQERRAADSAASQEPAE